MLLNQNYLRVVGCIQSITTTLQREIVKPHILLFQVSLKLNKKRKDYLLILLCIMVKECYLIAFRLSSELKQIVLKRLKFTLFQLEFQNVIKYSESPQVNKSSKLIRILRRIHDFSVFFSSEKLETLAKPRRGNYFFSLPLRMKLFPHFPLSHPENPPKLYHRNNDIVALSPELDDNHFLGSFQKGDFGFMISSI